MIAAARRHLYRGARALGDWQAIRRGRYPQRLVRRFIYGLCLSLAARCCRVLGVSR